MKKFIRLLIILILLSAIAGAVYLFYLAPGENFQSVYLVPGNAAFIIETEHPFDAWNTIVHSQAWQYLKTNKLLSGINKDIEKADSMVNSNRLLLKLFGSRTIMISSHAYKPGKYEFLYVVDLKKTAGLKSAKNILDKILGTGYRLTQRNYKEVEIMELLEKESGDIYYFSFIRNQLVFSQIPSLIEASIDQLDKLTLGRDLNYIDVARKTQGKGLFSICINYPYFKNYYTDVMGKPNDFVDNLAKFLYYTSAYVELSGEGLLKITGLTSVKDTSRSVFNALMQSGYGPHEILGITPQRTASVIDIGFDNAEELYTNFGKTIGEETWQNITTSLDKTEKKLKISIRENFLSWIDREIALIQTQPSNLGKNNEFAVVFKARNGKTAFKNLAFMAEQLKKNSPVKFREVEYKGYTISYLHIPGIFKFLFGKLLEKLDKPYFSVIADYAVFSNHPQTIKSIIDDYEAGKTVLNDDKTKEFIGYFPNKSIVFLYFQTPVLFSNLKEFVSPATWLKLNENKEYFESFPDIGIHIDNEKELLRVEVIARFDPFFEEFVPMHYLPGESYFYPDDSVKEPEATQTIVYEPVIHIDDLDAPGYKEFHANGTLKLEVDLKKGMKNGNFREYYENGEIKIRGRYKNDLMDGTWKYYDENGKLTGSREYDEGELAGE